MGKKVELLAPAGDMDSFTAAVENGADAVYLGSKQFNARRYAGNFDQEGLKRALYYAHIRDVRVYLAVNTLMLDSELYEGLKLAEEAYVTGVDGFIVQDLGFSGLLKRALPEADLHASTQMTVYNLEGVKALERLGFRRAVLARELSIEEIRYISGNTAVEIEIFVHGALCICYSGQCLMSSIIGGRSGNRGKCAQPCRLPYEIVSAGSEDGGKAGKSYIMSPKDLCAVPVLKNLVDSGVKSLKIEGRMKSPEYVATVVKVYRKYIDSLYEDRGMPQGEKAISDEDFKELLQVFNRGGFSTGYLTGKTGKDMMCFEKPKNWGVYVGRAIFYDKAKKAVKLKLEDQLGIGDGIEVWNGEAESPGTVVSWIESGGKGVDRAEKGSEVLAGNIKGNINKGDKVYRTSSKTLNTAAKETYTGKCKTRVPLKCKMTIKSGSPVSFFVEDNRGNKAGITAGYIPEEAVRRPITDERVIEQVSKTGDTPFVFSKVDAEIDGGLSVPVSVINDLRRKALEEIADKRAYARNRIISNNIGEIKKSLLHFPGNGRNRKKNMGISVLFYNWNEKFDSEILKEAYRLYLPFEIFMNKKNFKLISEYRGEGCEIFVWLPAVTRGNYDGLIKSHSRLLAEAEIDGILLGNLGLIEEFKGKYPRRKMTGDYSLNMFNSFSIEQLRDLGLDGVTLSAELNLSQINSLRDIEGLCKEVIVYGRIPVMISEYCPVGSVKGGFGADGRCDGACRRGNYMLKDRKGAKFPVIPDKIDCRSIILNSSVLFVPGDLDKIAGAGIDTVRMNITDESPEKVKQLLGMHRDIIENGQDRIKSYDNLIEDVKMAGFTKGHYFRGV